MSALALAVLEPEWDRWWLRAACRDTDPGVFFPPSDAEVPWEARRLCEECEVRQPCGDHALRHELHGVWAGISAVGREHLRRTLRIHVTAPETVPPPDTRPLTCTDEEYQCT